MSPATVVATSEISLNGVFYRTKGPVQSSLSSIYPQKTVQGDFTKDSQQRASVLALSDWRGGIGVNKMRAPEQINRAWWSTCQLRYRGHLVLPGLAVATAAVGSSAVGAIGELGNAIYAAFGTDVRKYNNTTDSWGSSLATLQAAATDSLTFRMNGVVYLAFATAGTPGGYTYTSDGITWTDDTKDTQFLAWWDDRLWGIDATGQLWFSTAIGVETNEAQLPLPSDSVTSLFVGRAPNDSLILYAGATYGLWAHDIDNARFGETELTVPQHPDNGKGADRWRDSTFYPVGNGIWRYVNGGNQALITIMGPDRDDGLPSDKRGIIRQLLGTTNELLAIFDATSAPGTMDMFDGDGVLSAAQVIEPDTGFSSILGWNEGAWECKWLGGNVGQAISWAYVSNAYSTYRLWWATNQRVYYMALPRDIVNPNEITTFVYALSADHETPWFNADQEEVDKLMLELRVECAGMSATETAVVSYGTNYSSTYTQLGTITASGVTSYLFPNSTSPSGTGFRAIRFKVSLARGTTTTLTPDVLSLTMSYRKKLPAKYSHTVELDLMQEYKGNTPKQLRAALVTALASATKVELTFRDDTGTTRNYWVDVVQGTGLQSTGHDERGATTLTMVEP